MNKSRLLTGNIRRNFDAGKTKTIIFILIIFNFFIAISYLQGEHFVDGLILFVTNAVYCVVLFALTLINTLTIYKNFEKNYFYILRFKDKKEYLGTLLKTIVVNNLIFFLINLAIIIIYLTIFSNGFVIMNWQTYNISNLTYVLFYMIRFFILMEIVMIISVLLMKLFDKNTLILFNVIIWSSFLFYPYELKKIIGSVWEMHWMLAGYLRYHFYTTFSLEVLYSIIFIFLMAIICWILFCIVVKKRIGV